MLRKFTHSVLALVLTSGIYLGTLVTSAPVAPVAIVGVVATCALTQTACNKDQLLAAGEDVLSVVTSQPLQQVLQVIAPGSLTKLTGLLGPAKDLIAAIKNGNTSGALNLVNTIFPVIEEIASIVASANPVAMAVLALANIALHFIINHTQSNVPKMARMAPAVRQALAIGAQKIWGCEHPAKDKRVQYQELCHAQ